MEGYLTGDSKLKLHFNLKQRREQNELTQIILTTTINRHRIRVYTKMRVEPRYWDNLRSRCILESAPNLRERMRLANINEKIEILKNKIFEVDDRLAEEGKYLSASSIREVVDEIKLYGKSDLSPLEHLNRLVDAYLKTVNRRGKRGNSSTKTTYIVALQRLENYCKQKKITLESFNDFDKRFFRGFTEYLYTCPYQKGKKKLYYTQNTIVNTLKVIKNLLRRAYDSELTDNTYFLKVQTTLSADVSEQVYLQEREVKKIARMHLEGERRIVRDMFVIACYTALRISDIQKLGQASIQNGIITIYQTKTKELAQVPILKEIAPIVAQYQAEGFPRINKVRANAIIKELAKECGINEIVNYKECRGGSVCVKQSPKWERISFHTARRSCITNLYRRGYPVNYIMTLSGHHSVSALQRYIRASLKEVTNDFVNLLKKEKAL